MSPNKMLKNFRIRKSESEISRKNHYEYPSQPNTALLALSAFGVLAAANSLDSTTRHESIAERVLKTEGYNSNMHPRQEKRYGSRFSSACICGEGEL